MKVGEDLNLITSILDGNVDSFNILVNKYEVMVLRFIYNMIKDKEAAEDITQDVFIKLLEKKPSFENEEHEKAKRYSSGNPYFAG